MMLLTRSSLPWATVASLLAVSALLGMGGPQRAQAQTQETTITIENFFVRHRSELQPGAVAKLQAALEQARKCPSDVTVEFLSHMTRGGMAPVGNVRYHTLLGLLAGTAAGNSVFKVEALPNYTRPRRTGTGWGHISDHPREPHVSVRWTLKPDHDEPKLDVIWTPPKGKKVKPGDTITAKLTARDDATAAQTGIARLRVDVDVGGGLVAAPAHYPSPVPLQECGRENPVRTYEATYTVPPDPPPVVKLRANARDFAGNERWDDAEFPTTDWFGTIKKTAKGGGHNHNIDINFEFVVEPDYSIKGRAHARISTEAGEVPGCTFLWTYSPSEFDIPLSGRRDGENFEIALEPGTITATVAGCGQSNTFPGHLNPAAHAEIKYRISAQDGATNTVERNVGALPWGVITRDTIEIHRAQE